MTELILKVVDSSVCLYLQVNIIYNTLNDCPSPSLSLTSVVLFAIKVISYENTQEEYSMQDLTKERNFITCSRRYWISRAR